MIDIPAASMTGQSLRRTVPRDLGVLLLAMVIAVLVGKVFLGRLGTGMVWVMFYPAVVIASFHGGWLMGLLSSVASCLIVLYAWPVLGDQPFIMDYGDGVGMFAFLFNCAMIAGVAEVARRARVRATRAKEQAEADNRAKSVFLANVSHELRPPLNAIVGFSNLMRDDPSDSPEHRQALDIITRSGEHLLGLVDCVREIAKVDAGRTAVEHKPCDLHAMMQDLADLMRQRAEARGLHLTLAVAADLPRVVETDESKLRQVVLNLVDNAVKFTSQGGVTLRLASQPLGEPHLVRLVIDVEDTGDGIAAADQPRMFDPFVQLGHKSDSTGSGLGLTITRQFVELMGGVIYVKSAPGYGSTFSVELPVRRSGASEMVAA